MPKLDFSIADAALLEIVEGAPLPGLGGDPRCKATAAKIVDWSKTNAGSPLLAGLWLLAGELDKSHMVSQTGECAVSAAWHGIMHRREGDFSNAKYWFRQAQSSATEPFPLYEQLRQHLLVRQSAGSDEQLLTSLLGNRNLAGSLVECVATASGDAIPLLRAVCWLEWQILFMHQLKSFKSAESFQNNSGRMGNEL